jgi:hypothetical protein
MMDKIKIVKNGITRSIFEKDSAKWGTRGYKRVESVAGGKTKAKAKAE